ncbi:putative Zn finger-like uncharacterized protein [Sphingomonas vulcanisoli]|uniref:Zn finger-like uncharacterized protein n=1 Tax=Sphingomonas vulcanisoli TaxID=1658060 RepID=A0ABX0TRW4_9SPHN|nr:zinc-ribbon domain-containing protein [Sphingomonas vulcanisoli]NIJ06889.1 putative Zn finger-like uncharacterized protein [Sphingomonas vulcanisoli]
MRIVCPNCATGYEVAETAIGPNGRKVRCRACDTSWIEPPRSVPQPVAPAPMPAEDVPPVVATEPAAIAPSAEVGEVYEKARPRRSIGRFFRGPLVLGGLALLVILLGLAIAFAAYGPKQVASTFGIGRGRVPLGIAITRQPDWRMIAGGSELFAVTGRIWNPTDQVQPIPDIKAELKDAGGKTVYAWTIARPQAQLAPKASVDFDGAAVDVPRSSQRIAVSLATEKD